MAILGQPDVEKSPLSNNFQHPNRTVISAYDRCHRAEQVILADLESPSHTRTTRVPLEARLVNIRLLGHLMDKGPGDTAASHIAQAVVSAEDDDELNNVGKLYLQNFIRTFRKAKGRTPQPSEHQSRTSFNNIQDIIKDELVPTPQDHQEARQKALVRDNFRCMLSGSLDTSSLQKNDKLGREPPDLTPGVCDTHCCHILSESTNSNIDRSDDKAFLSSSVLAIDILTWISQREYAATAWAILEYFGHNNIHLKLAGNKVHSLENILTLDSYLHTRFDQLELWLEATDKPHCYKVCTTVPIAVFSLKKVPRFVTFESTSPGLALPSSEYLGLHAACCRVAHMSGAAGYLDMLDDIDDNFDSGASNEQLAGDLMVKLYNIYSIQPRDMMIQSTYVPVSCFSD
ncbi:hypothetical protein BD779DRAFT_1808892 [Infundibulicybe gibba]|nr:hypothetical protein BD779DRAFT_1808892 [Infundibulicybe gibba]